MAAIISSQLGYSGVTLYGIVRDQAALVANGTTLEAYNPSNWATYVVPMTEQSGSGFFVGAFPAYLPAGPYSFSVHQGSGVLGDQAVDSGAIDWSGSSENYLGLVVAKLPSGTISGFDPTVTNVNLSANQSGVTIGTVNNLGTNAAASVKTQVDTALDSDVMNELVGVPSATPTLKKAIMFLFMAFRNKRTSTATAVNVFNASGAVITSAVQSDNSSTYTKENFL